MQSLKEKCYMEFSKKIPKENKGEFISNFMTKTPKLLHTRVLNDMVKQIEKEKLDITTKMMEILVPYITRDIISCINTVGRTRENYYEKFDSISPYIVESSIITSEKIATDLYDIIAERHTERHTERSNNYYNLYHNSEDEMDDDMNYGMNYDYY